MSLRGSDPYFSVVASSRNDDHGDNLRPRMQMFVDGLAAQANRHRLQTELIVVEWNPPCGRPPLSDVLRWPPRSEFFSARIVTVPHDLHAKFEHAQKLPLFQMIAKNVGIRRARGRFVLATNIDILFSDAVFHRFSELKPGLIYRCDRYDVPTEAAMRSLDEIFAFCRQNAFRINARGRTLVRLGGNWRVVGHAGLAAACRARIDACTLRLRREFVRRRAQLKLIWIMPGVIRRVLKDAFAEDRGFRRFDKIFFDRVALVLARQAVRCLTWPARGINRTAGRLEGWFSSIKRDRDRTLHTNACGDFTLMAREDWFRLRGYPEWPIFSWHIDSVILHQARANGMREIDWPTGAHVYHIEHGHGSGYTPEGAEKLFARLDSLGVPYLSWPEFKVMADEMYDAKRLLKAVVFNEDNWGLADVVLPETELGSTKPDQTRRIMERA